MASKISKLLSDVRGRAGIRILVIGAVVLALTPLLSSPSSAETFSNTTPIVVTYKPAPPGCPGEQSCYGDNADPYPSSIEVSGLSGLVTDVNVTLHDLWMVNSPSNLDILVQMPDGMTVLLMSDACGNGDNPIAQAAAIDLTFDDSAAAQLPADTACVSGTFRPVDDDNDTDELPSFVFVPDTFPTPGTCDADTPCTPGNTIFYNTTDLSTFEGMGGNGTWNLYVISDQPGDPVGTVVGGIDGGWSLDITTSGSPTTTTVAPTTTTAAPTTTSMATTTTLPATTTSMATTTTLPATTTSMATTTTLPATTTTAGPTTTTAGPTTTTAGPTTTTAGPTTTTAGPTTTTVVTPGGPLTIDATALSNGEAVRISGTITCDEGMRFRLVVEVSQGDTEGTGVATGSCTGEEQTFRLNIRDFSGPGFEAGTAQVDATAQIGDPETRTIVDTFSTSEEVDIEIRGGFVGAVVSAFSAMENRA